MTLSTSKAVRTALFIFALCLAAPAVQAGVYSSPTPTVTVTATATVLRMELNGYGNYGAADTASDILYTGDAHVWSFEVASAWPALSTAFFRTSLVADDHYSVPLNAYQLAVTVNGQPAFTGAANLQHGDLFAGRFTNWSTRDDAVLTPGTSTMTLGLANMSVAPAAAQDWIAVDWIELHLVTSPVPEPSGAALLCAGLLGLAACRQALRVRER